MKIIACIPSRFGSTRLPGKPLIEIHGKPMILHVVERAKKIKQLNDVVVLTDDQRIFDVVNNAGHSVAMTSPNCQNGTERLIEFLPKTHADILVNIQGDELMLNGEHVDALITDFLKTPNACMGTLAHFEKDPTLLKDPTVAKIVIDHHHNALYFSRACIPVQQSGALPDTALVQMGIYIYTRDALLRFSKFVSTPLEQTEKLEQLRALENGMPVHITIVETEHCFSIDTPEDLKKVTS